MSQERQYSFICKECGYIEDEYRTLDNCTTPSTCDRCGGETSRNYNGQIVGGSWGSVSPFKTTE